MAKEIKQNMMRPRAKKLPEVTDEMWSQVDEEHRNLTEEFLDAHSFRKRQEDSMPPPYDNSFGGYIIL